MRGHTGGFPYEVFIPRVKQNSFVIKKDSDEAQDLFYVLILV
jgi:hypothetical protein